MKLSAEKERASGRSYAGVASATPASTTHIKLFGGMDQNMLACMLHAHMVNMGSSSSYQATLNKLFAANGLTPITMPQNSDSAKIFDVVPGGKCTTGKFKINTNVETSKVNEAEAPKWRLFSRRSKYPVSRETKNSRP